MSGQRQAELDAARAALNACATPLVMLTKRVDWNSLIGALGPVDRSSVDDAVSVVHGITTDAIDGRDPQVGLDALRRIVEGMSTTAVDTFAAWWLEMREAAK